MRLFRYVCIGKPYKRQRGHKISPDEPKTTFAVTKKVNFLV